MPPIRISPSTLERLKESPVGLFVYAPRPAADDGFIVDVTDRLFTRLQELRAGRTYDAVIVEILNQHAGEP